MDQIFKKLCLEENDGKSKSLLYSLISRLVPKSKTINLLGRELIINKCCGQVADMNFDEVRNTVH